MHVVITVSCLALWFMFDSALIKVHPFPWHAWDRHENSAVATCSPVQCTLYTVRRTYTSLFKPGWHSKSVFVDAKPQPPYNESQAKSLVGSHTLPGPSYTNVYRKRQWWCLASSSDAIRRPLANLLPSAFRASLVVVKLTKCILVTVDVSCRILPHLM